MPLNLNELRTPGVYIDEIPVIPPSVAPVATAIPAFVGYTQTSFAEGIAAIRISSFLEYREHFGGPPSPATLGIKITVTDTFQESTDDDGNVTSSIHLTRTMEAKAAGSSMLKPDHNLYYALQHYFANGGSDCYIVSVGAYGTINKDKLIEGINVLEQEDEPTLIVIPEAVNLASGYDSVYEAALNQCNKLKDRFTILNVRQTDHSKAGNSARKDIEGFQKNAAIGNYGLYGAAYYPYLQTRIAYDFTEADEQAIEIEHKKILENGEPAGNTTVTIPDTLAEIQSNELKNQISSAIKAFRIVLPPDAAVAAIYNRVDSERGVWKAPANVAIGTIIGPAVKIDNNLQDDMNVHPDGGRSINAIRNLTNRGTVIWGARTLDGNSNEWRYINVRRFFNFVEESVKKGTFRFVFEPNDANSWTRVQANIENFLTSQWSQGALQGSKPSEAFFVKVGLGQTMTPQDILEGRLIVEIGMAVVRPAEFIILRFMHKLPEA